MVPLINLESESVPTEKMEIKAFTLLNKVVKQLNFSPMFFFLKMFSYVVVGIGLGTQSLLTVGQAYPGHNEVYKHQKSKYP